MGIIQQIANYLSCKTDTVVTILVTLTVFISGIFVNLILARLKRIYDRYNYRIFFKEVIENIRKYTIKQSCEFEKFHKSLRIDNHGLLQLEKHIENSLQTFDKLPLEKIFDSYFGGIVFNNKKRRKALRFILNNTQIIKDINSDLSIDADKMISKYNQYENGWNKGVEEIRKTYDLLRHQHHGQTLKTEYMPMLKEIDEIFSGWNKDANIAVVKEAIIDKLPPIITKYKSLDVTIYIENSTIDAKVAYANMENVLKIYAGLFSNYQRTFRNYNRKMKVAQKIVRVKNFCR